MNDKISSINKAINILKRLAEEPFEMTVLNLSNELQINRSTVHRIINILKDESLVLQNPYNKKYCLGPTAYHIGASYVNNYDQIRYMINDIALDINQSVGFVKLEGEKIINIYEVETYQPIRMGYRQGQYYPIHCGAYGKCTMAFYEPKERLEKIVYSTELVKNTPNTITDPEKLLKEYEKIRKDGYAISDEENVIGLIGIGAPVFNFNGKIIGTIASALIKSSTTKEDIEKVKMTMINGAKRISKLLV
ncbi:KdgR family transcriptional regulator [Anaeromicrobium sediminis]|uniref:KdgR family transcriptional regulator n=1 Tax=Anaeromicrobium sediminis TaxID=1478221 RepID=A0A267MQ40_9FIRM|nr:KdgR family transcriptional regulator [Anaeromicrobium sediminis]